MTEKTKSQCRATSATVDHPKLLHPRYWPTWLALGLLRLTILLPWRVQVKLAQAIGFLLYYLAKRRRLIAQTNIALCFPEMSKTDQKKLLKDTLFENAMGIFETAHSLWSPDEKLKGITQFYGLTTLNAAIAKNKGVILVGAHFTTLDLGGRLFTQFCPVDILYRPHKDVVFNQVLLKSRSRWAQDVYQHKQLRRIVKAIKQGHVFWYPADQDYGPSNSVFAPFFNINAATLNTTARLATMTQAPIFVLGHHRCGKSFRYEIHVEQVTPTLLKGETAITTLVNQHLEREIRRYPAQYMWVHRRFKTRPPGQPTFYNF